MTPEHQDCSGFISSWIACDLKNHRSAAREYLECFDARNFLHGCIHEKTTGKTDVKILLLIRIITNACKIQIMSTVVIMFGQGLMSTNTWTVFWLSFMARANWPIMTTMVN
jgi:hypothetical protein